MNIKFNIIHITHTHSERGRGRECVHSANIYTFTFYFITIHYVCSIRAARIQVYHLNSFDPISINSRPSLSLFGIAISVFSRYELFGFVFFSFFLALCENYRGQSTSFDVALAVQKFNSMHIKVLLVRLVHPFYFGSLNRSISILYASCDAKLLLYPHRRHSARVYKCMKQNRCTLLCASHTALASAATFNSV